MDYQRFARDLSLRPQFPVVVDFKRGRRSEIVPLLPFEKVGATANIALERQYCC